MTVAPNTGLLVGSDLDAMLNNAGLFMASGLVPSRFKTTEAVVITAMYGRGLGLDFATSLAEVYIVNGIPSCSSKIQLGVIKHKEPECQIKILEQTDRICKISIKRKHDDEAQPFQYTIDEAKVAGLLSKTPWKNHPTDMLTARALTRGFRSTCMDLIAGFGHTAEELEDVKPKAEAPTGKIPKQGDAGGFVGPADILAKVTKDMNVTDVEVEEVEAPPNKKALEDLSLEMKGTDQKDLVEMIYDAFREKHSEDKETLAEGYDLFELRKAELESKDANKD